MCAPLCSRVSPDPYYTHTCHHLFFAGGPRQSGLVGRIRACISASMRAVIILQPHPMCHPVQPPRPAPGPANCNCRCGSHPASLGGGTVSWESSTSNSFVVQHSKISRYMSEDSSLSEEEWESCLTSLLLGTQPIANFHVAAHFTDESLGIEIGNRVSGATVRYYLSLGPRLTHDPGPHQTFESGPKLTRALPPGNRRHSCSETQQVCHREYRYVRLGQ